MPVPLIHYLLSHDALSISTLASPRVLFGLCLLGFLLSARHWTSKPLPQISNPRRLRNQTILLHDPRGFSPSMLPLIETLLKRNCQVVLLVDSEHANSERVLQLYAVLKENGPVQNPQLYIERMDIASEESRDGFVKEWKSKGMAKKGLLGEDIGVQSIAGVIFNATDAIDIKDKIDFAQALLPLLISNKSLNNDPLTEGTCQTRMINLTLSPFYAAATLNSSTLNSSDQATRTLKDALLWSRAQKELKAPVEHVAFLTLSTGVTRNSLMDTLSFGRMQNIILLLALPFIWAFGKSNSEASSSVEWMLVLPESEIQGGSMYRDGHRIRPSQLEDEALSEQLWREFMA